MVVVKTSFVMNVFVLKHVCVFVQIHRRTGDCCAVVKSEKTGDIKALSCMEYNVPAKNIREDKLLCVDEKGLPACSE